MQDEVTQYVSMSQGGPAYHKTSPGLAQHDARLLACKARVHSSTLGLVGIQLIVQQADESLAGNIAQVAPAVDPSHALHTATAGTSAI